MSPSSLQGCTAAHCRLLQGHCTDGCCSTAGRDCSHCRLQPPIGVQCSCSGSPCTGPRWLASLGSPKVDARLGPRRTVVHPTVRTGTFPAQTAVYAVAPAGRSAAFASPVAALHVGATR